LRRLHKLVVFKVDSEQSDAKGAETDGKQDEDAAMEELSKKCSVSGSPWQISKLIYRLAKWTGFYQEVAVTNTKANGGRHDV